ncbi:MAG: DUF748 domain-containing protein [Rhodoferax sp.]|nr:DUF748 domain-containing protein [Rhodoferax sp.]
MPFETTRPETAPATSWMKRLRWAVAALLAVWALLWLAVPPLAKREIEKQGTEALGRAVTLGAVDFRPWSLRLTLSDLAVATADGQGKQFTLARLQANLELESLLRMVPVLDALTLDAPHLNLTHGGQGRYDIDDVLQRLNKPSATPAKPLQFALYNLQVTNGSADFTDTLPTGARQHLLRKLEVRIPFLSNLEYRRAVQIQPHLAFELNGSTVDTALQGTPFDTSRAMEARLKVPRLDLAPWLPYVPAGMAVRPTAGVLDADLRFAFSDAPKASVKVTGHLGASGLVLKDAAGAEVLRADTVTAELEDVRPLERVATLASLTLDAPALRWVHKRAGRLEVELLDAPVPADAPKSVAKPAHSAGAASQSNTQSTGKDGSWKLALHELKIQRGQVRFTDENFKPAASVAMADVALQASALQWPLADKPIMLKASANFPNKGKASRMEVQGDAAAAGGAVHVQVRDGALVLAEPWVSQHLVPKLRGTLDTELDLRWQGDKVQVAIPQLTLTDVVLSGLPRSESKGTAQRSGPSSNDLPRIQSLALQGASIDLAARTAGLGKVTLRAPSSGVRKGEDGRWMYEAWLKAQKPTDEEAAATPTPWRVQLESLAVSDGVVAFSDRSKGKPVRLEVSGLSLQTGPLDIAGKEPVKLTLAARLRAGQTEPGSLSFKGTAAWAPMQLRGQIEATDVPAHALAPYFADRLNLEILRADVSLRGRLRYADTPGGAEVNLRADAALEEFRANNTAAAKQGDTLAFGEELLSWKALNVPGVALRMAPGKPMRLQVREVALTDFFARIAVAPDGRISLQDLIKPAIAGTSADAAVVPAQIMIGPMTLVQGKVLFSDRFVQPNYSADLSELTGKLGQFATQAPGAEPQLADLELRGRAEGTAALEITGKINPLAKPLLMDIQAQVRDLELPPLSPYAIKYAGYSIDRGKMSVTAHYKVERDGQLTASNKVVLNQLAFGEAVASAPNSLPVKLVTALLADDSGMIDIELPISGSLNDPQFSIGPVIWKVITNVIAKALTSPFSLLDGGDGDANESGGRILFALGSSALDAQATQALDKVVQTVGSKAALSLTVIGTAHLETERDALKRERLKALLLTEKRRRQAQDAAAITGVTVEEAPALLRTVYRRAEINKPRNILGLAKELEPREMENLLLASLPVDADAMRALALARGVAVKDYLAAHKFPAERLFLGSVKVDTAPQPAGTTLQPAAELSLTTR